VGGGVDILIVANGERIEGCGKTTMNELKINGAVETQWTGLKAIVKVGFGYVVFQSRNATFFETFFFPHHFTVN
jgi:hypothetical protein